MDVVRVLRVIEYVGPREAVEALVDKSIHGARTVGTKGREVTIRGATVGSYPEILSGSDNVKVVYDPVKEE